MTDTSIHPLENPVQTMRDVIERLGDHREIDNPFAPEVISPLTDAHLVTLPDGRKIHDLTSHHRAALEYLKPARRKGTARLDTLTSIIDWAGRFTDADNGALFAKPDMANPSLTCIANYHTEGAPADGLDADPTARHADHRAVYNFPLSDEWKAWMVVSGEPIDKDAMGEFIEANAKDIMDPTPAILNGAISDKNEGWENRLISTAKQIEGRYGQLHQLLAMSKQFQVFESSDLQVSSNRDSGEAQLTFKSEHRDAAGKPLSIPNLIIVTIPVFRCGTPYRMPARFRYRKRGPNISFVLSLYNPEKAFEAAFTEAVDRAQEATALPLFFGAPEG